MKHLILSPNSFSVADCVKERNTDVFPTEQNSLQEKGARKDLVVSWIVQAFLYLLLLVAGKRVSVAQQLPCCQLTGNCCHGHASTRVYAATAQV